MTDKTYTEAQTRYMTAKGYFNATIAILDSPHHVTRELMFVLPTHMLIGFALELYFKAWLLGAGVASKDVRKYGHDLRSLYRDVKAKGLSTNSALDTTVETFADAHENFTYRYIDGNDVITPANFNVVLPLLSALDTEVDKHVGASASHGLTPGH